MKKLFSYIKKVSLKELLCSRAVLVAGDRIKIIVVSKDKHIKNKTFYYFVNKKNLKILDSIDEIQGLDTLKNEVSILKLI